jgi:hypothetical protein
MGNKAYHRHSSKNNRKSKGRNNNPSREEICQLPAGTTGGIGVICGSFGNEVGDGGDDVENQDEQGPVDTVRRTQRKPILKTYYCLKITVLDI